MKGEIKGENAADIICSAMKNEGMHFPALAERLGISRQAARLYGDRDHAGGMRISTLRKALDALGYDLEISAIRKKSHNN